MSRAVYRSWAVAESRRKLKARAVEYKGGKCGRCGYDRCHAALEFHHIDPEHKDISLARGIRRRWEIVRRELDKCILLCSNCHREEHETQRKEWLVRQREVARASVPEKRRATVVPCSRCGKRVKIVPLRAERASKLFCSTRCSGMSARKGAWPRKSRLATLVWKVPAVEIGKRVGVSSSAVKKMCTKLGIATPGRGYWTKTQTPR